MIASKSVIRFPDFVSVVGPLLTRPLPPVYHPMKGPAAYRYRAPVRKKVIAGAAERCLRLIVGCRRAAEGRRAFA